MLNNIFIWNNIEPPDELIADDCEFLKSMFNSEPVVSLFSYFDENFSLIESKAFLDTYSVCYELPINLIFDYFLDCHIQYIYLIKINQHTYYLFMYNYDSSPVSLNREQTYCKAWLVTLARQHYVHNLMDVKVYGFHAVDRYIFTESDYWSFKDALYFCTHQLAKKTPIVYNDLYTKIIYDAHIPLCDLYNHSVYYKD